MFAVQKEYYYRIHHIRSRFKRNVESRLYDISHALAIIPEMDKKEYNKLADHNIKALDWNKNSKEKTIKNIRTEISSLFGLIINVDKKTLKTGNRALELVEKQDLIEFFRIFLLLFQYPGGHTKSQETLDMINHNVRFKPAKQLLWIMTKGERIFPNFYITSAEATHCIFNDLRVTRDHEKPKQTLERIINNRKMKIKYNEKGDVIRYSRDILDYMVIANLLTKEGKKYYLNTREKDLIKYFIINKMWFSGYDIFYNRPQTSTQDVANISYKWFNYIDMAEIEKNVLSPRIEDVISDKDKAKLEKLIKSRKDYTDEYWQNISNEIGDEGEELIVLHEKMKLEKAGRECFLKFVRNVSKEYGLGYDVQSREINGDTMHIEVKTTKSHEPLTIKRFRMTPNEWMVAKSEKRNLLYI